MPPRAPSRDRPSRTVRRGRTIPPLLRLQRYLLSELLLSFGLVLAIVTGVFLMGSFLQILGKYPETSVVALFHAMPIFIGLALPVTTPLAFLMACLLSYGRFADDNEFLAFRMGGISPRHAISPAICAAVAISIFTVALATDINPVLTSARKSVLRVQVADQLEHMRKSTGAGRVRIGDMEMSWGGRRDEWFLDVIFTFTTTKQGTEDGKPVTKAQRATGRESSLRLTDETPPRLAVTLVDAHLSFDEDNGTSESKAAREVLFIDLEDDDTNGKGKDEMRSADIFYRMGRLEPLLGSNRKTAEWRHYRDLSRTYWKRVAMGLSPLAFALIGVPIGLLARRGSRGQPLVIALLLALPVYYPLLLWGETLARLDAMPIALALNLPNFVLGIAGIVMLRRVLTR